MAFWTVELLEVAGAAIGGANGIWKRRVAGSALDKVRETVLANRSE